MATMVKTGKGLVSGKAMTTGSGFFLLYNYDSNGDAPKTEHLGVLQGAATLAAAHKINPGIKVEVIIEGHADPTGNATENLQLSRSRADKVRQSILKGGASASSVKVVAHGSDPRFQLSKGNLFGIPAWLHKETPKGGNPLDRSVEISVVVKEFVPEGKFDEQRAGIWDEIVRDAYKQACHEYLYARLPDIMKQILPSPTLKGVPIPWTGPPSGGDTPEEAKTKIRKHAVDIIMEALKKKKLDRQFTRAQVEAEYDKRIAK